MLLKFAELLGEVVVADTKANLQVRVDAEHGACQGKMDLATLAKELNLDAIHDTVHEMCKDEARHGKVFRIIKQILRLINRKALRGFFLFKKHRKALKIIFYIVRSNFF